MQLKAAPIQRASDLDRAGPAAPARTAATITLVGCFSTALGAFLPWVEDGVEWR